MPKRRLSAPLVPTTARKSRMTGRKTKLTRNPILNPKLLVAIGEIMLRQLCRVAAVGAQVELTV